MDHRYTYKDKNCLSRDERQHRRKIGVFCVSMLLVSGLLWTDVNRSVKAQENEQSPASSQTSSQASSGRSCVDMSRVKRSKIIDDKTILLYLSGKKVRKMSLKYKCPSLKFYKFYSYKSFSTRLCARIDHIISRTGSHCVIESIEDFQETEDKE